MTTIISDEKSYYWNVLEDQISIIISFLRQETCDLSYSHYNSVDELIESINTFMLGTRENNKEDIKKLLFLFLPTGELQEISIESDWPYEFLDIADKVENAVRKYVELCDRNIS